SALVDLRVLGMAPGIPLSALEDFYPIMRVGFWINAMSGLLLLIAYPTKALTNPMFYAKLTLIALAVWNTWWIRNQLIRKPALDMGRAPLKGKMLAIGSLTM